MASGTLQAKISLMDIVWRVTTNAGVGGLYFSSSVGSVWQARQANPLCPYGQKIRKPLFLKKFLIQELLPAYLLILTRDIIQDVQVWFF